MRPRVREMAKELLAPSKRVQARGGQRYIDTIKRATPRGGYYGRASELYALPHVCRINLLQRRSQLSPLRLFFLRLAFLHWKPFSVLRATANWLTDWLPSSNLCFSHTRIFQLLRAPLLGPSYYYIAVVSTVMLSNHSSLLTISIGSLRHNSLSVLHVHSPGSLRLWPNLCRCYITTRLFRHVSLDTRHSGLLNLHVSIEIDFVILWIGGFKIYE